jgi:hypothetical protein
MRVITVARKPLSEGTVAANTLKHKTGALNIDASRIGEGIVKQATAGRRTVKWGIHEGGCSYEKGTGALFTTEGRWPANLILQHKEGCECVGTNWSCVEGCPVKALDAQSGTLKSGAMDSIAKGDQYNTYGKMYERRVTNPASEGGASRFFKQIK